MIFFLLDSTRIVEMFAVNIDVTCKGSQQPWCAHAPREPAFEHRVRRLATARPNRRFLASNLCLVALIILLASADLADPLRFKQVWRTHVSERKRLVAAARGERTMGTIQYLLLTFQSNVMYKQCEVVITYLLQGAFTMISLRLPALRYTDACNRTGLEMVNAFVAAMLSVALVVWLVPILPAALMHSIGPAPPISKDKLKVRALPLARFVAPPLTEESRGSPISGGEGEEPARA